METQSSMKRCVGLLADVVQHRLFVRACVRAWRYFGVVLTTKRENAGSGEILVAP
jgi:hypothetical protein